MKRFVIAFLVAFAAATAHAESAKDAATGYEVVKARILLCRTEYRSGILKARMGQATLQDGYRSYLDCKTGAEGEAKKVYQRVMARLKTPAAKAALKDYQVALMSALAGSDDKDGESGYATTRRQNALDAEVERTWQRLQLEL